MSERAEDILEQYLSSMAETEENSSMEPYNPRPRITSNTQFVADRIDTQEWEESIQVEEGNVVINQHCYEPLHPLLAKDALAKATGKSDSKALSPIS